MITKQTYSVDGEGFFDTEEDAIIHYIVDLFEEDSDFPSCSWSALVYFLERLEGLEMKDKQLIRRLLGDK